MLTTELMTVWCCVDVMTTELLTVMVYCLMYG
jgi:hypothetical protein